MLMHFKNKQRRLATFTLSAFLGSWLLLLCQTCFAANDDSRTHQEASAEMPISCHTPENVALEQTNAVDDEHCLGVCDCDSLTITFSSDKSSELKEKIKYSPDLYSYIQPEVIISSRAPPGSRIFTIPDGAILLPLQTYNVLLI
jgi:hypothetical protein